MEQPTSNFEYAFSLFALLLGFSLVEVLGGFARVFRTHDRSSLGTLAPMLGFIVMLDLISFWAILWHARTVIPVASLSLLLGFLISGAYYLAAASIFPEGKSIDNFDDHYLRIRRKVIGAILFCNLLTYALISHLRGGLPQGQTMVVIILFVTVFGIAALVPDRWRHAHRPLLALLISGYVLEAGWFYGS